MDNTFEKIKKIRLNKKEILDNYLKSFDKFKLFLKEIGENYKAIDELKNCYYEINDKIKDIEAELEYLDNLINDLNKSDDELNKKEFIELNDDTYELAISKTKNDDDL